MTHAELIDKWQHVVYQSRDIFTWTEPLTLCYLAELASRAETVIEVGVYMGKTSRVMCDAGARHLWAIDPFMVAGTESVSRFWLRRYIELGVCEVIPRMTRDAAPMLAHMNGKIDLIFVDDGHAYGDVITDITCFLPLLKSGGIMCGHDFETNPENDVARAVKHLLPSCSEPVPRLWQYIKP